MKQRYAGYDNPKGGRPRRADSHNKVVHAKRKGTDGEWPDALLGEFVRLMGTTMSYGMVTAQLNGMFPDCQKSRNAVLGKASRMGLRQEKPMPSNPNAQSPEARSGLAKRRNRRVKKNDGLAPVVFGKESSVLRAETDIGERPKRQRVLSNSHPEVIKRKKGHVPCIIETNPLTSRPVAETDRDKCMWPTSDDISCMEVCGVEATVGAYCERHAQVAYRVMPTTRRNRSFGADNREYRKRLEHEAFDTVESFLPLADDQRHEDPVMLALPHFIGKYDE